MIEQFIFIIATPSKILHIGRLLSLGQAGILDKFYVIIHEKS